MWLPIYPRRQHLTDRGSSFAPSVMIFVGIRWKATQPNWRRWSMLGFLPNQTSCGDLFSGRAFVGKRFLILLAVPMASAQKGVGSLAFIKLGLAMSNRVLLRRSAAPLEAEE